MNELYHYGIPRRSGRYPFGSGERPYQGFKKKNKNIKGKKPNQSTNNKKKRKIKDIILDRVAIENGLLSWQRMLQSQQFTQRMAALTASQNLANMQMMQNTLLHQQLFM